MWMAANRHDVHGLIGEHILQRIRRSSADPGAATPVATSATMSWTLGHLEEINQPGQSR